LRENRLTYLIKYIGNSFRFLSRRGWLPHFLPGQGGLLEGLDTAIPQFYRQYPSRAALTVSLFFLSWLLHSLEVYLMFWLLGRPISPGRVAVWGEK
jgi:hypothetical protein